MLHAYAHIEAKPLHNCIHSLHNGDEVSTAQCNITTMSKLTHTPQLEVARPIRRQGQGKATQVLLHFHEAGIFPMVLARRQVISFSENASRSLHKTMTTPRQFWPLPQLKKEGALPALLALLWAHPTMAKPGHSALANQQKYRNAKRTHLQP